MKTAYGLFLAALLTVGAAFGQAPPDRLQFLLPVNPDVGGWYSPDSNFGGITFDVIYDPNRAVVAGQWQFQVNGIATDVFFQTDMHYSTQEEAAETGIIASFDSPTFAFAGRGDYVEPTYNGSGTPVMTGRTIRMEFNSTRTGTFIDNPGQADARRFPVVASLRGAPLVAPADYSGDWMVASRTEATGAHFDFVGVVSLAPYSGPETYQFFDTSPLYHLPPATFDPPQPGARRYRLFCPDTADYETSTPCDSLPRCAFDCPAGEQSLLIWINPDETGRFAQVFKQASSSVLLQTPYQPLRVYGDNGKITVRGTSSGGILYEMQFVKVANGIFRFQ